jgi:hypothetical protein
MKISFIVLVLVSSAVCAKEHIYPAAPDTAIKSLVALDLNSDDDFESSTSDNETNN